MNQLILNRVAIWRPKLKDEFATRKSPAGRVYLERGIAKKSDQEMTRYAKNYTISKGKTAVKICLMLMSFSESEKTIEKFLDETSKKIDLALAQRVILSSTLSNFEYTDFYFEEDK